METDAVFSNTRNDKILNLNVKSMAMKNVSISKPMVNELHVYLYFKSRIWK